VDTRVAAGPAWDDAQGQHIHFYAPFDLRLFAHRDGCYHFIGDPTDFGYRGATFAYYGAHPVHAGHGGGWCFAIGGHAHAWRPWDARFRFVGPWYFWTGAYDRHFWAYWPYWAYFYEHHYPTYYRGGRFHGRLGWAQRVGRLQGRDDRSDWDRDDRVAPPITRVPPPTRLITSDTWRARPPAPADRGGGDRPDTVVPEPRPIGRRGLDPDEPALGRWGGGFDGDRGTLAPRPQHPYRALEPNPQPPSGGWGRWGGQLDAGSPSWGDDGPGRLGGNADRFGGGAARWGNGRFGGEPGGGRWGDDLNASGPRPRGPTRALAQPTQGDVAPAPPPPSTGTPAEALRASPPGENGSFGGEARGGEGAGTWGSSKGRMRRMGD
jgi:hypothetical protein